MLQLIGRRTTSKDGKGIISKYITVEGSEPDIDGVLRVTTGNQMTEAKIYVKPEKELLLSEGMVFQPESITLRPNQLRKVYLFVYIKMIGDGSEIRISSDNEAIRLSKDTIIVNEFDAKRHTVKNELDIWGEGVGQNAMITAEYESYGALLEVHIRSKEDKIKKSHKGMFSDPEFSYEKEPLQRTSYSEQTGKVTIYVNFPSIRHYLGDNCQYKKTLPAQVLIADLVAEKCFYEIAKKKVAQSKALIRAEAKTDRIQRDAYELSKKYGKKLHEALVDQNLIEDAKSLAQSNIPANRG